MELKKKRADGYQGPCRPQHSNRQRSSFVSIETVMTRGEFPNQAFHFLGSHSEQERRCGKELSTRTASCLR
jgi:hypothetical protein